MLRLSCVLVAAVLFLVAPVFAQDVTVRALSITEVRHADLSGKTPDPFMASMNQPGLRVRLELTGKAAGRATHFGEFTVIAYRSQTDPAEHLALVMGDVATDDPVLVRVHSQCLTGDVFHSLRCDCGEQVEMAMKRIAKEGRGVVLYMRQEGRGIGIHNKIKAYALQDEGMDTVEANLSLGFKADQRDYGVGAQVLADLGIRNMRLMTNNPKKMSGLESYGLKITEQLPITAEPNKYNRRYLKTKQKKMGHLLKITDTEGE